MAWEDPDSGMSPTVQASIRRDGSSGAEGPGLLFYFITAFVLVVGALFGAQDILDWFNKISEISTQYGRTSGFLAGLFALFAGMFLYKIRDVVKHSAFPPLEIALGCFASSIGFMKGDLVGIISFITGIRIVIDGVKRFREAK